MRSASQIRKRYENRERARKTNGVPQRITDTLDPTSKRARHVTGRAHGGAAHALGLFLLLGWEVGCDLVPDHVSSTTVKGRRGGDTRPRQLDLALVAASGLGFCRARGRGRRPCFRGLSWCGLSMRLVNVM